MIGTWEVRTSLSDDRRTLVAVLYCPDWNERITVNTMFYSLGARAVPWTDPCDGPYSGPYGGRLLEEGVTAVIAGPTLTVTIPDEDFHLVAPLEVPSRELADVKWLTLYTSEEPGPTEKTDGMDWLAASVPLKILKENEA